MGITGYAFTDRDRDEFNRMRRLVDSISGPNVRNDRHSSITIGSPPPVRRQAGQAHDDETVVVIPNGNIAGGVYSGNYSTGTATGYNVTAGTLTGMSLGAAVIIINGPELGSTASEPYLGNAAKGQGYGPLFGKVVGVDSASSKTMILVNATGLGCADAG